MSLSFSFEIVIKVINDFGTTDPARRGPYGAAKRPR
jgi:hypothetical protein